MTGVLGFEIRDEVRQFDEDAWSWSKSDAVPTEGASSSTTVPFAIDLRQHRRWVAFATSASIRHGNFGVGLMLVLNHAVQKLNLWPTDWDFDLAVSKSTLDAWLHQHPRVFRFVRTIRFSNPGLDLDDERAAMRALGANRSTHEYAAPPGKSLDIDSRQFQEKIEGIDSGDTKVRLWARGHRTTSEFRSEEHADRDTIEEFGSDLARGMELVLAALRVYRPSD
jgi:hypothetical protein